MRKKFRKILGCLTLLFLLTSCGGMTNSSEITKLETKETQQEKQQTNKQNVEKTVSQETRQNYTKERRTKVPVWEAGLPYNSDVEQIFVTYENGYSTARLGYTLSGGWLDIGLRAKSAVVLKKLNNQI